MQTPDVDEASGGFLLSLMIFSTSRDPMWRRRGSETLKENFLGHLQEPFCCYCDNCDCSLSPSLVESQDKTVFLAVKYLHILCLNLPTEEALRWLVFPYQDLFLLKSFTGTFTKKQIPTPAPPWRLFFSSCSKPQTH